MSEGPTREEIERAREALERHDAELHEEDRARRPGAPDDAPTDEDDER